MLTTAVLLTAISMPCEVNAEQMKLLKVFRDEFVEMTPGKGDFPKSFMMGDDGASSSKPVHKVTFQHGFSIGKYEVPQDLWQAVMGDNPSKWTGKRNSVEMLSFDEAIAFCEKATKLMREAKLIDPKQIVRLPSEAEWEYAARAGTTTKFSFGEDIAKLNDYGWHTGNASGNDPPVGAKKPNPWGLYDMHGYLWEWCLDAGHDNYAGAPADGTAWTKGGDSKRRIMRGGSWKDPGPALSSANRDGRFRSGKVEVKFSGGVDKELKDDAVGLRCVLSN